MRIAHLTSGRFTMVDLGRELSAMGHDVKVYSLVPKHITRRFGLPDHCNRWLGARCAPFYGAARFAPEGPLREHADQALLEAIDRAVIAMLEPCDVVVAMSGIAVRALDYARRHFGARIFVERSSVHILEQRDILQRIPGTRADFADRFRYERELVSYALADTITVPAQHVYDSFIARGFRPEQLFLNPFGVSLDTFKPTPAPARDARPTILTTGSWSLQKGCDVLVEAWRKLPGVRLLHVGSVVDCQLPDDPLFEHVDAVPQRELPRYYAQGHVFVLASRQEGLAVVQAQALACGLPLVCTTMTGGAQLKPWTRDPDAVRVVAPDDADALASALGAALSQLPPPGSLRDPLGSFRAELAWPASARRYERRLLASLGQGEAQALGQTG